MNKFYIDNNLKIAIKYNNGIEKIIDYDETKIKNIYRARVKSVVKNMECAFIDIGDEEGFLSFKDSIGKLVEGDDILVQVKKIPGEDKSNKLTMELSLDGKYMVVFSNKSFVKFSKKISKESYKFLKELSLKNDLSGVLFRTNAEGICEEDILEEYKKLKSLLENILKEKNLRPTPKLIYNSSPLLEFIRDNVKDEEILVNDKKIYLDLKEKYNIKLDESFGIRYNLELLKEYKKLFNKVVEVEGGSNIIIEHTSAMTTIDVNSANFNDGDLREKTIFDVNRLCAYEIVKQIKLRKISGIIIIDFIDMAKGQYKDEILLLMKELLKDEPDIKVHGYTNLNLMELSKANRGIMLINKLEKI